jgi:FtsZ-binding cell division protein ZapB
MNHEETVTLLRQEIERLNERRQWLTANGERASKDAKEAFRGAQECMKRIYDHEAALHMLLTDQEA